MESTGSEWKNWEIGENDSLLESFQKQEDIASVVSGEGGKSDTMYDSGNNIEGEDSNFQFDSMEDSEESESNEEEEEDSSQVIVDQSPYRFMNGTDGMSTCERCGNVGIKHAFYSKAKRFCSLACSRAAANGEEFVPVKPLAIPKKQIPKKRKSGKFIRQRTKSTSSRQSVVRSFDWGSYIVGSHAEGCPVSCFKHVPVSDVWENVSIGMKVEVQNLDCDLTNTVYWIATVMKLAGYKALLRYEGFGNDGQKDFWVNVCHKEVHPVGWCATSGQPLVPPKTIQHKYADWKDYLVKRLTGSRTLPSNFYSKVQEGINNHRFVKGTHVEVVNRMCVSAMRVATVEEVIGGRLRLRYEDAKEEGDEFWCHMRSALLHPVGWSQQSGHKLHSSQEYRSQCLGKITMQKYDIKDATPDMFMTMKSPPEGYKFQVGMKLEAIDPLNLSAICVATVMKVLKNNCLMIGIDGSIAQNGSDWFCYHATSPCIFPVGFCEVNGLLLTPPRHHEGPFKWFDYLKHTRSVAAPVKLFDKEIPKHGFKAGMKLEAVDLMEPRLICVATVAKVVGRLLRIHFDGWESEYDQWVDCESPDLYPIGWCEMIGYPVEGPRLKTEVPNAVQPSQVHSKKRKGKTQIYKGPQRKPKTPLSPPSTVKSMSSQLDLMRLRLLNTRPEEVTERPQEVPQFSDMHSDSKTANITVKTEPMDTGYQHVPTVDRVQSPAVLSLPPQYVTNTTQKPNPAPLLTLRSPATTAIIRTSNASPNASVATKSALLERITSTSNPTSSPSILQNSTLAGHLTGAIPISRNSALVPTSNTPAGGQVMGTARQTGSELPQTLYLTQRHQTVAPENWTVVDVCHFLKYNDCSSYVEIFHRKNINGEVFINLSKEAIVGLTGMKVGSSLKVYDLIQVLKSKMAAQKLLSVHRS
ncbi:MBT domain-containing protein 1-like isoform X2 [Mya arenaria]|uniref:MBT domain-containing protein 1-like isoform X2 n=1 Tax=Mya arenaria TaxID=6604 RepID=UPI0022E82C7E|nr:MBT domain-containing protein 1-like isoform X2 [Mya arenaria]